MNSYINVDQLYYTTFSFKKAGVNQACILNLYVYTLQGPLIDQVIEILDEAIWFNDRFIKFIGKAIALVAHYVTVRLAYRYTMLNPHLYNHRLTSCATREATGPKATLYL